MAKTAKVTKAAAPTNVCVRYDLLELRTAQHKAGLAGLVLQVESMKARGMAEESVPLINVKKTTVEATFTEASLRGLFDDLYDAKLVERRDTKRGNNNAPKRIAVGDAKAPEAESAGAGDDGDEAVAENDVEATSSAAKRPTNRYVYDVIEPYGHFLRQFTEDGKEIWHKLWRDMLWSIPRGRDKSRLPFKNRAAGKSCGEGEAAWNKLLVLQKKSKNEVHTCEVSSAILLGAQAKSAESVPFRDRVDHALLLHFWQLTTRVFVPQIDADGKRNADGYVLAVPEVADLVRFIRLYRRAMRDLPSEKSGYRPAAAVISLPQQGALEFMDSLARLAGKATSANLSDVARALAGVELHYMVKVGNNAKSKMHGYVVAEPHLLTGYDSVKATSRNPMFRAARLLAMLRDERWYAEFDTMMAERPWPLFVQSAKNPDPASFAGDAAGRFWTLVDLGQSRMEHAMTTGSPTSPATNERLETLIFRLVRTYVRAKSEQRSGIAFKRTKKTDEKGREYNEYPVAYTEAQEKVCSDLFLGLRSRRDEDFVSYFTGTVGSVAQGPNMSTEADYCVIAQALLDEKRRGDVKTLAMLAVSAASFARTSEVEARQDNTEESPL